MTNKEAIADIRDNIKPIVGGISLDMAIKALEQQSFEGKTNGDVIKAMFPSVEVIEIIEGIVNISLDTWCPFSEDWWNAPYERGEEDG